MNKEGAQRNHQAPADSVQLSRLAALNVGRLIVVQSLSSYVRICIRNTCVRMEKESPYSKHGSHSLLPSIHGLAKNCNSHIKELEKLLLQWFAGKYERKNSQDAMAMLSLMDANESDLEVLKANLQRNLKELASYESSNFRLRWKKVQGDQFVDKNKLTSPLGQGLFILDFIRDKALPEEIESALINTFVAGYPEQSKKIYIELNEAFEAMGLEPGGWEVVNGTEHKTPTYQFQMGK